MDGHWRAGLWMCCFQFFVAEQIARLGWTGHYSMARNYISDLGSAQSSLHWVMNASFILQGLLISVGALLVRGFFPAKPAYRVALVLFAIAGVGVLMVGLAPEDVNPSLHIKGAIAHFLGGNLAMIVLALAGIRQVTESTAQRSKNWLTIAAGSIGLLATLALAFREAPSWRLETGIVERMAAYPLPPWLTWKGYLLLRGRGQAHFR
jgi:hypothetical membrane protein